MSGEHTPTRRERVLVAVTGGPESETLIRRGARIAARTGAELMVAHVVTDIDDPAVSAARHDELLALITELGATMHELVADDVPAALLTLARNAEVTQLVIGTSRRPGWAHALSPGIGTSVVQRSGPIDVHMVSHTEARRALRPPTLDPGLRRISVWVAAVVVPSAVCALITVALDHILGTGGKTALFFIGVLIVALAGGVAPAAVSAVLSSLLLNYFLTDPRQSFTIAEPDAVVTEVVLLLVALAVAILVDRSVKRAREAGRATREARLLTVFAGSVLRGADPAGLLERVRETYGQRSVSLLRRRDADTRVVACVGEQPCPSLESADTAIAVGDDEFWMLLSGHRLDRRDREVLGAVANQAAALVRQHELSAEASRAEALAQADELRRALLSAVSHDLRTPLAAAKAASSSLRTGDVGFSPADTEELLATVDESIDQLSALVGNLLDSSRLAAGVIRPTRHRVYLEEVVQRALVSIGKGATGFARPGIDRVVVDVGDVVALADAGLLERVLANLIDNALRYAPTGEIRVDAEQRDDRVHISVRDTGPGVAAGTEAQIFGSFQRLGDNDNTSGVGLGLSVARGFVEAMGGTVAAENNPGGGLTMTVDLAAPTQAAATQERQR